MQQWFGIEEDKVLLFAVLLHVGTLVSVFIVYWKDVWELIKELGLTIRDIFTGRVLRIQEDVYKRQHPGCSYILR